MCIAGMSLGMQRGNVLLRDRGQGFISQDEGITGKCLNDGKPITHGAGRLPCVERPGTQDHRPPPSLRIGAKQTQFQTLGGGLFSA